ncbi:YeeE/YedE family protein [Rubrobacter tropicus]|uniref:YeeE/YedE family protein n=1 Tax=Rubrobacter tropicus TaxID=2653851 RepID=A0A6G8Q5Q4_9ACTN|nr:YeeE/YedE thiosulfate transporter family protein [Rubrobacter tropicus]QIN81796.1 YeeE/YedE family protein [Rubrobacter tropicus]
MEDFTPVSGLLGGLLIGLAVALLLWLNGRLAGISGIVGGLVPGGARDGWWRWAFVAGLVLGALAYVLVAGGADAVEVTASLPVLVVGGLLVGFGTRLGSGCTSGHGLCGLARSSRRSVVATAVFFGVAMLTVFVGSHVL